MDEQERQRRYVKGLGLLDQAFESLRDALEIDDKDDVGRPELQIALLLRDARDQLHELTIEGQPRGIKAATDAPGGIDPSTF
jgi:hypothetical protein